MHTSRLVEFASLKGRQKAFELGTLSLTRQCGAVFDYFATAQMQDSRLLTRRSLIEPFAELAFQNACALVDYPGEHISLAQRLSTSCDALDRLLLVFPELCIPNDIFNSRWKRAHIQLNKINPTLEEAKQDYLFNYLGRGNTLYPEAPGFKKIEEYARLQIGAVGAADRHYHERLKKLKQRQQQRLSQLAA